MTPSLTAQRKRAAYTKAKVAFSCQQRPVRTQGVSEIIRRAKHADLSIWRAYNCGPFFREPYPAMPAEWLSLALGR